MVKPSNFEEMVAENAAEQEAGSVHAAVAVAPVPDLEPAAAPAVAPVPDLEPAAAPAGAAVPDPESGAEPLPAVAAEPPAAVT